MAHPEGGHSLARTLLVVTALCASAPFAQADEKATPNAGSQPQYQTPQYQYTPNPPVQYPGAPATSPKSRSPGAKKGAPQNPYSQYPGAQFPKGQYRGTEQDQQACVNDVFRLCNQAVPDVTRIIACLQSNKPNLSPPCRAVFSRGRKGR